MCIVKLRQEHAPPHDLPPTSVPQTLWIIPYIVFLPWPSPFPLSLPSLILFPSAFPGTHLRPVHLANVFLLLLLQTPPPMQHPAPSHFTVILQAPKSLLSRPLPLSEICTGPSCLCSQKQSLLALSLPSPPHYLKIYRLQVTRHEERRELPVT